MVWYAEYTGRDLYSCIYTDPWSFFRALGQASPCMSAFAAGQAAALKLFEAINRKPQIDAYDPSGRTLDNIRGDIELRDVYSVTLLGQMNKYLADSLFPYLVVQLLLWLERVEAGNQPLSA